METHEEFVAYNAAAIIAHIKGMLDAKWQIISISEQLIQGEITCVIQYVR